LFNKHYILEKTIAKEILKNTLSTGTQPAIEFLYARYSDMLYGYVLQFIPDHEEAEDLLVRTFTHAAGRLKEACGSGLGVYCWLQIEARKIILHYKGSDTEWPFIEAEEAEQKTIVFPEKGRYYFSLLRDATYEQKWIFRELFLIGKGKEEVARRLDKDLPYVERQLKESLIIINRNLT